MISLDYVDSILKSKRKSSIFGSCLLNPSCSIEIALNMYQTTETYQDTNVSKVLNELRSHGLVEEVDYEKYKVYRYCERKRAKHYYITDEIFENMVRVITKRMSGSRKINPQAMAIIRNILKNRKSFLEYMRVHSNLNFTVSFENKKVNLKVKE